MGRDAGAKRSPKWILSFAQNDKLFDEGMGWRAGVARERATYKVGGYG